MPRQFSFFTLFHSKFMACISKFVEICAFGGGGVGPPGFPRAIPKWATIYATVFSLFTRNGGDDEGNAFSNTDQLHQFVSCLDATANGKPVCKPPLLFFFFFFWQEKAKGSKRWFSVIKRKIIGIFAFFRLLRVFLEGGIRRFMVFISICILCCCILWGMTWAGLRLCDLSRGMRRGL